MNLTTEQRGYRRAVYLLGELEDRMGNTSEWLKYEAMFNYSAETGLKWNTAINAMSKKLDALAGDQFDEPVKCPHCGVMFEYSKDYKCCEDCTV